MSKQRLETDLGMGLANLHDAFLQASLQRKHMEESPISLEPAEFMMSNRGRFERIWVALLYVLLEAWKAHEASALRDYIRTLASCEKLDRILSEGESGGFIARMRETRHYVCHRDKRQYWDPGRLSVGAPGQGQFHLELHDAFGEVLLTAKRKNAETRNA